MQPQKSRPAESTHRFNHHQVNTVESYRDDNNNVDVQMHRLVRLQHLAQREIKAGWQPPVVKFHDFLNALASAEMGKQPGPAAAAHACLSEEGPSGNCISNVCFPRSK